MWLVLTTGLRNNSEISVSFIQKFDGTDFLLDYQFSAFRIMVSYAVKRKDCRTVQVPTTGTLIDLCVHLVCKAW